LTKTTPRARYTLEFKQEAVRLVEGGESIAATARTLGVVDTGHPALLRMRDKRQRGYRAMGYRIETEAAPYESLL
jgi:transposase-like protein